MIKKILIAVAVILFIAIGVVSYSFFRTPEAATEPIEAIPLDLAGNEAGLQAETGVEEVEPAIQPETQADAVEAAEPAPETEVEIEAVEEPEQAGSASETEPAIEPETQTETVDAAGETEPDVEAANETEAGVASRANESGEEAAVSPLIFELIPSESEARFLIDEVLRGTPKTVVGATDQVAGQFAVEPNDLSTVRLGVLQINARTLTTDNQFRNRAIKNVILLTDDYEFITFTPTEIVGLPASGAVGQTYTFQIVGDLSITDVTRQVTFDVTASSMTASRIEGTATANILYPDFELFIPDSPSVDTVADEVRLELEFVAETI